jgi:regulatory protein
MSVSKEEAFVKLARFCAYQERCLKDVYHYFFKLEIPPLWHEDVIQQLQSLGYLDENRFVDSFVSGKFRLKKWGKKKIYAGLKSKGISNELIANALINIDLDIYYSNLLHLAKRKSEEFSVRKKTNPEITQKLVRYLLQKGYEMDLISDVVPTVLNE